MSRRDPVRLDPQPPPAHPGTMLNEVLLTKRVTVTAAARALKVSRVALSRVLNGRVALSPEMAIRFAKVFFAGDESAFWRGALAMQFAYDLAQAAESVARVDVVPFHDGGRS